MVDHIPELLEAGIDSLKVEGRMTTALYVAAIARAYRKAIDDCLASEESYRANLDWYLAEVSKCTNRRYTTGFYFGRPDENTQIYDSSTYVNEYIYLGIVEEAREITKLPWAGAEGTISGSGDIGRQPASLGHRMVRIEQRNKFAVGDTIEIMHFDGRDQAAEVLAMYDQMGTPLESCPHSKQTVWLELSAPAEQYDLLRMSNQPLSPRQTKMPAPAVHQKTDIEHI